MRAARRAQALAALLLLGPAAARAQLVCQGHPIRFVVLRPSSIFSIEHAPFPALVQRVGTDISWQTRPATIRRELRFQAGDSCDVARLAESERILRALPYIRLAIITTEPAPGDSVDVVVSTRDDWSLGGDLGIDTRNSRPLRAARLTELNLLGTGTFAQIRYDDYGRKPGLAVGLLFRQIGDTHSDAEVLGGRTSVGTVGAVSLRRVFQSEYDRIAWGGSVRWRAEPFIYNSLRFGTVVQPTVSAGADVGLVWRTGPVGRRLLLGGALSSERLYTFGGGLATLATDDSAATAELAGHFQERRRVSVNVIAGIRHIRFVSHAGVDAVNAPEDIREGVELRAIGGIGVGGMGLEADRFGLIDVYLGTPVGQRTLAFFRSRIEGRYLTDSLRWDNIIAAADLFTYTTVSPRGAVTLFVQTAGGWNTTTPFQLDVAGFTAMRGFGHYGLPAGRRVVVQLEHRYFLGTVLGVADLGTAAFMDVGRGWAGDAVFGQNTFTLVALGVGLRAGVPSGSRFATRLDIAVPVNGGHGAELRLTLRQQFGITRPEPADIERSRLPVSTSALFNFTRY
ncbi:MAG TPA: hypothetical protein VGI92_06020 [Gemmatimonadales bacterium]|jgi:hypothetical protein